VHMVFPTVSKSRPEIIIRKKLPMPLPIECYVEAKVLSRAFVSLFKLVIHGRGSMIIAGPPFAAVSSFIKVYKV
jgi:Flp pilus assembly CpaF family ATPase